MDFEIGKLFWIIWMGPVSSEGSLQGKDENRRGKVRGREHRIRIESNVIASLKMKGTIRQATHAASKRRKRLGNFPP